MKSLPLDVFAVLSSLSRLHAGLRCLYDTQRASRFLARMPMAHTGESRRGSVAQRFKGEKDQHVDPLRTPGGLIVTRGRKVSNSEIREGQ